jgi:photosystem II stability/assembly factor-like uncharacterized protein
MLRFTLPEEETGHLYPESVLVARWDDAAERFKIIPSSGYDAANGYAFAKISRPGVYAAIGLPRDPRILTTLRLLAAVRPWINGDPTLGRRLIDPICQMILCAPFMEERIKDPGFLDRTGLSPGDFPGGYGGNICDRCLGLDPNNLPELDIVELGDLPIIINPKWENPIIWPRPCQTWTNLGPRNVTGRVGTLAIHPTNGNILYAGTTGGGVWKTTDGGINWYPRMHGELSLAIGGLGIAASDPNVLYAATGEWTGGIGWPVDPVIRGVGVYRTSNGGDDWDLCAPIPSPNCAAVAVDPGNANRVFVAGDMGLHRSVNGGASWDIPPGRSYGVFDGEVSDVVIDRNNLNRLYIGVHNDGVYRSTDGGNSWTRLQTGIATGGDADSPKIALGRNGANGSQFVAVKMGDRVYTSTDGGNNFTRMTDVGNPIWFIAWANVIAVDPDDQDILFAGASNLYRSTDGGASWSQVGGYGTNVHADMQSVVFDPADHNRVFVATDGGIWRSTDNGATWAFMSVGLTATHFYVMGVSHTPILRYGGAIQDDHGYAYNSSPDWFALGLGEGGYLEYDPSNVDVLYHDTWGGTLFKSTNGGTAWTDLSIATDVNYAEPLAIARGDTNLLLALKSGVGIARSTNGGSGWTDVLTPGVTFTAVCFAPSDDNRAYAGSDSGRIWRSTNGGASWTELDRTALPFAKIQSIAVDWTNPNRIYLAFAGSGIRHLFRGDITGAANVTWFDVSGVQAAVALPDLPLTGLALDPLHEETLFVSTLLGVLRSTDGGDSWAAFDDGLPNAFVSDLDMRPSDRSLFACTMGRGIYRRYL